MNSQFSNESFAVVRAPLDPSTGNTYESCQYALFPGIPLAQSEPELVVLLYDSLLHQYPDTAMLLYQGQGADPLLNRKYQQRLLTHWRNLGKPIVILATPEDRKLFRGHFGEIPTVSLYDLLIEHHVSGGCNRELYRLSEPEEYGCGEALRQMAEMMGVTLVDSSNASSIGDISRVPFLTSSVEVRNSMKKNGFEAVHILELIYGMGRSNQHLTHTHAEGHDHSHDEPPKIRDTVMSDEERAAQDALFDEAVKKQNLRELHDTLLSFFWGE